VEAAAAAISSTLLSHTGIIIIIIIIIESCTRHTITLRTATVKYQQEEAWRLMEADIKDGFVEMVGWC